MDITDVKYIITVIPCKISSIKRLDKIEMKKNMQTNKVREKMGINKSNFVKFLTISNRYRLVKNISVNKNGRTTLFGLTDT